MTLDRGLCLDNGQFGSNPTCRVSRVTGHARLTGFHADFAFLLGASFADPGHAAVLEDGRVFIEDKLDHLAAPEVQTSAQPKTFFRGIEDETGEPLLVAAQIDDQTGGLLRHQPLRAAALGHREAGHFSLPGLGVVMVRPD